MKTFMSADGSTRCRGCHLYPDQCTCEPGNSVKIFCEGLLEAMTSDGRRMPPRPDHTDQ